MDEILRISRGQVDSGPGPVARPWRVGAVLRARVMTAGSGNGRAVVLRIQGRDYTVDLGWPVTRGEVLRLRVIGDGENPLLQRVVAAPASEGGTTLQNILRELISRQIDLVAGAAVLLRAAARGVSEPGQSLLRQVLATQATFSQVADPGGLKAAVQGAGLHLENRLAAGLAPYTGERKALLLSLTDWLGNSDLAAGKGHLEILVKTVRGLLARHEVAQMLSRGTDGRLLWVMELPLVVAGGMSLLSMEIEVKPDSAAEKEDGVHRRTWQVRLNVGLEPMGSLDIRIRSEFGTVSARFVAERKHTVRQLSQALPDLARDLKRQGIVPGRLTCERGSPADSVVATVCRGLAAVDIRA